MVEKGIAEDTITAVGFGEEQPIAGNETQADKEKNRRIEFNIGQ